MNAVMPLVDVELRRLAGGYMRRERAGHTLQPTALVNEAVGFQPGQPGSRPGGRSGRRRSPRLAAARLCAGS